MSSLTTLIMSLNDSNATFLSYSPLGDANGDPRTNADAFRNYWKRLAHGDSTGSFTFYTGAAKGTAVMTVSTGGSSNGETMKIANVTFTAETSGATGNQFNINSNATTQANSMVAAFNASADLTGIVTASNVGGVITFTAVVPGLLGNGIQLSESLTNVAITTAFETAATGSNGTAYTVDLS